MQTLLLGTRLNDHFPVLSTKVQFMISNSYIFLEYKVLHSNFMILRPWNALKKWVAVKSFKSLVIVERLKFWTFRSIYGYIFFLITIYSPILQFQGFLTMCFLAVAQQKIRFTQTQTKLSITPFNSSTKDNGNVEISIHQFEFII